MNDTYGGELKDFNMKKNNRLIGLLTLVLITTGCSGTSSSNFFVTGETKRYSKITELNFGEEIEVYFPSRHSPFEQNNKNSGLYLRNKITDKYAVYDLETKKSTGFIYDSYVDTLNIMHDLYSHRNYNIKSDRYYETIYSLSGKVVVPKTEDSIDYLYESGMGDLVFYSETHASTYIHNNGKTIIIKDSTGFSNNKIEAITKDYIMTYQYDSNISNWKNTVYNKSGKKVKDFSENTYFIGNNNLLSFDYELVSSSSENYDVKIEGSKYKLTQTFTNIRTGSAKKTKLENIAIQEVDNVYHNDTYENLKTPFTKIEYYKINSDKTVGELQVAYVNSDLSVFIESHIDDVLSVIGKDRITLYRGQENIGLYDFSGKKISIPDGINVYEYKDGLYAAKKNSECRMYDSDFKEITTKGYAFLALPDNKYGFATEVKDEYTYLYYRIDRDGKEILIPGYAYVLGINFPMNLYCIGTPGLAATIYDFNGNKLLDSPDYGISYVEFKTGVLIKTQNDKCYLIS